MAGVDVHAIARRLRVRPVDHAADVPVLGDVLPAVELRRLGVGGAAQPALPRRRRGPRASTWASGRGRTSVHLGVLVAMALSASPSPPAASNAPAASDRANSRTSTVRSVPTDGAYAETACCFGKKTEMITADRGAAGSRHADARSARPRRARHAAHPAVPRRHRDDLRGDGLLLGRRADLLERPGRVHHRRRLHGRLDQAPDLRGDLHRPDRPHRDGDGRVRSGAGVVRSVDEGVLGEPRPDHAQPSGRRRRHAVPVGDLPDHRRSSSWLRSRRRAIATRRR